MVVDFERELLSFPAGKHDDMVDAFTLALSQLSGKKLTSWWFEFGGNGDGSSTFSALTTIRRRSKRTSRTWAASRVRLTALVANAAPSTARKIGRWQN